MPDAAWLGDVAKLFGGGVVGWLGRIVSERNKKRRMRRHLYKEITENYTRVAHALCDTGGGALAELSRNMNFSYFAHAQRDMDTFHSLDDYTMILALYKGYRNVEAAREHTAAFGAAKRANEVVSTLITFKNDTGNLLLKSAPRYAKAALANGALAIVVPSAAKRLLNDKRLRRYASEFGRRAC